MAAWPGHGPVVAVVAATLVQGTDGAVPGCTIVVEGGRFGDVGPDARVPAGAVVLDAGGAVVVPGLVDAHVHLGFAADPRLVVRGGITAVRDMGWPPKRFRSVRARAEAAGLHVSHVGPILTAPGGYPTRAAWAPRGTGREVATEADARSAVAEVAEWGGCALKLAMEPRVGPVFAQALLERLVLLAHDRGLPVTVHAGSAEAVEACLAAGVDELAHVPFDLSAAAPDLAARCARTRMRLVPTLHCRDHDDAAGRAAAIGFLRSWFEAGGEVVYGTDLGNANTAPGADVDELALIAEGGLSPSEVLVAATAGAAAAIGAAAEIGTIERERRADLLVLADDPRHDVTALARPRLVVAAGRPVM